MSYYFSGKNAPGFFPVIFLFSISGEKSTIIRSRFFYSIMLLVKKNVNHLRWKYSRESFFFFFLQRRDSKETTKEFLRTIIDKLFEKISGLINFLPFQDPKKSDLWTKALDSSLECQINAFSSSWFIELKRIVTILIAKRMVFFLISGLWLRYNIAELCPEDKENKCLNFFFPVLRIVKI